LLPELLRHRDEIERLATVEKQPRIGARAYRSTTQAITTAGGNLVFDTEVSDVGGCWSAANGDQFVAPSAGYYSAQASFYGTSSANATYQFSVIQRTTAGVIKNVLSSVRQITAGTTHSAIVYAESFYMAADEYVGFKLDVFTNTITTGAASSGTEYYSSGALWRVG
jgi:hypothetical protein